MLSFLRTSLVTFLICCMALSGAARAADDEEAAGRARAIDPRPEAHMTLAELEQRTAAGDLKAQAELGSRYGLGYGVEANLPKAIELLSAAAAKGGADAQFFLASAYAAGQGVPQNEFQAFALYEQAANQGHAGGNYMVANMIAFGRAGISPSWSGAMPHLWAAAVQGYPPAMFLLGAAYEDGKAGVVNARAAAYWYRRYLSVLQDPQAIFNLRRIIDIGAIPYEDGDPGDPPARTPSAAQAPEQTERQTAGKNGR